MSEIPKHDEDDAIEDDSRVRRASLDVPEDVWRELSAQAQAFVTEYLENVSELPIFPQGAIADFASLSPDELPLEGAAVEKILEECRAIRDGSRHTGHPRFFAYVASSASPVGVIADFMASALNQNLTTWRSAPAAVDVERMVVRWLATLAGYTEGAGGLLTSGGSMANLNALFIAQRAKSKSPHQTSLKGLWNYGQPMTIYASEEIHLSIRKAADVLGFGREQVRLVETDERFRLDVRALRERIESDARNGLQPFCVVASAGTVNTGAVDPFAEIAGVAREHNLWFHVDGAYGAPGLMDKKRRALFEGLELADSISLDPHKWLYAPIDCGCVLLREPSHAHTAFPPEEKDAAYIKIYEEGERETFAFWDYGVELTRRFRALKVWMILRYYGARKIGEAISEDIALAKYFGERIEAAEDFELLAPVELSICCFRYVPVAWRERLQAADETLRGEINTMLDELNERLMYEVQHGGRAYLSNATLRGRFALRACIVNFRTTRADIDLTLRILRETAEELWPQVNADKYG